MKYLLLATIFIHTLLCPTCQKEGKRSQVQIGTTTCTLMAPSQYYDEDGKYSYKDLNTCTTRYRCSNGHSFTNFDLDHENQISQPKEDE